eukprot:scaffold17049_cov82-Amphora_coffeaeformis.AAC.1
MRLWRELIHAKTEKFDGGQRFALKRDQKRECRHSICGLLFRVLLFRDDDRERRIHIGRQKPFHPVRDLRLGLNRQFQEQESWSLLQWDVCELER